MEISEKFYYLRVILSCVDFDLATESKVYGPEEDPEQEFFRIEASREGFELIFNRAEGSSYDFYARRPADFSNEEFLETVYEDPEVYPNSDVNVCPDFPIGEGPYQEIPLTVYAARGEDRREQDAIVEISLEESMEEEKVRWVNLEQESAVNDQGFENEVWYIGPDFDRSPVVRYLSQDPVERVELEELLDEVEEIFNAHEFRSF